MKSILRNYLYNLAYNLAALLIPMLTAPYLARTLGVDALGDFAYIQSTAAILCTISMLGTYTFGNRQVAYTRDDVGQMSREFCNIMGLRAVLGAIGSVVYLILSLTSVKRGCFLLYYLYYLGYVIDCSWLFVGIEDMRVCTLKNLFAKLGCAVCVFAFVKNDEHLWRYVLITASATFAANLSVYTRLKAHVRLCRVELSSLRTNFTSALRLSLPTLVSTVYLQVDKLMLRWITGNPREVTYYDQAEKIIIIPLAFITVLSTVMMPRIAHEFRVGTSERIRELLSKACRFSMFAACPLMFGMLGIATKFVPWYLGDGFMPVAYAVMVLSPYVLTNTLLGISGGQYFMATDQTDILLKSNIFGMCANIAANCVLIPLAGYLGAAVATVVSQVLMTVCQYYRLNRQIQILPTLIKQSKYLAYGGVMYVCVVLVGLRRTPSVWLTLCQVGVGAVCYLAILVVTRDGQTAWMVDIVQRRLRR